jgi:hypothetical protein
MFTSTCAMAGIGAKAAALIAINVASMILGFI